MHFASLTIDRSESASGERLGCDGNSDEWNCDCAPGYENVPVPLVFWLHSPPVRVSARLSVRPTVRPSIHPSVRLSVCLSVCLSVRTSGRSFIRSFVRCRLQRTSDECIAVWPRPEGSLTDYHLVFMVFEVLLNHLAASLLHVRLPSFPPSTPNVPSRPRRRRRWRRHGVHGDRREENRRDEERCERTTRTAGHRRPG